MYVLSKKSSLVFEWINILPQTSSYIWKGVGREREREFLQDEENYEHYTMSHLLGMTNARFRPSWSHIYCMIQLPKKIALTKMFDETISNKLKLTDAAS